MYYDNIVPGTFIERINRFIARVLINGQEELVHIKNTGRCKELFLLGAPIYLQKATNPNRKTQYSLISIYKNALLINIDSQVPNTVIYEALLQKKVQEFQDLLLLKREVTFGNSRFDLYYETPSQKGFIEIKGIHHFIPNHQTDPEFSTSLKLAQSSGIHILCFDSLITPTSISLNNRLSPNQINI